MTKKAKNKRRTRKYKPDRRYFEVRDVNPETLQRTYERLIKHEQEGVIVAPLPYAHINNKYSFIKQKLCELGALEIINEPKPANYVICKVNTKYRGGFK